MIRARRLIRACRTQIIHWAKPARWPRRVNRWRRHRHQLR